MPLGSGKPSFSASSEKLKIPIVLPITRESRTIKVKLVTPENGTPAFANAKKNRPKSTTNLSWCSNCSSGL